MTCRRPKYVSIVFTPETIRSSIMSRAECARKWYLRDGEGWAREVAGLTAAENGVEGGLTNALMYKGLF